MGDPKDISTIETDAEENSMISLILFDKLDSQKNVFKTYLDSNDGKILYADLNDAVQNTKKEIKYHRVIASPDGLILLSDNMPDKKLPEERIFQLIEVTNSIKDYEEIFLDSRFSFGTRTDLGSHDYYSYELNYFPHSLIGLQERGGRRAQKLKSLIELQSEININKREKGKD